MCRRDDTGCPIRDRRFLSMHTCEICLIGVSTYRFKTGEEDGVPATCRQLLEDSVERLFALPDFKPASTDAVGSCHETAAMQIVHRKASEGKPYC